MSMMGAQNCVAGISGGIVSAAMAAWQYRRGVMRANRGERRGGGGLSGSCGGSEGGNKEGQGCAALVGMGVSAGGVLAGGMLARVCRMCRRGAARAT